MIRKVLFLALAIWIINTLWGLNSAEASSQVKVIPVSRNEQGPLGKIVQESLRINREMNYNVSDKKVVDYTWVIINTWKRFPNDYSHIKDPRIAIALAWSESSFNPNAHSVAGCVGMFQVSYATAKEVCLKKGIPYSRKELRSNLWYNVRVGLAILDTELASENGNVHRAILNYKCGRGAIQRGGFQNARYQILYARWKRIHNKMV